MTNSGSESVDFDVRPPMPLAEYDQTVRQVNVGYELLFTLALAWLRSLRKPNLHLLVVGAGGGTEVTTFAPINPAWRFTGVDPSENMLALARSKVESLHVGQRVRLLRGTVDDLPATEYYDAATCIFVLHFIPDDGSKLSLLKSIFQRLRPGAPLILGSPALTDLRQFDDLAGAWQQYGELMGLSPEKMAATIEQIRARQSVTSEERHVALLREAGFQTITRFFSALAITGWIAR